MSSRCLQILRASSNFYSRCCRWQRLVHAARTLLDPVYGLVESCRCRCPGPWVSSGSCKRSDRVQNSFHNNIRANRHLWHTKHTSTCHNCLRHNLSSLSSLSFGAEDTYCETANCICVLCHHSRAACLSQEARVNSFSLYLSRSSVLLSAAIDGPQACGPPTHTPQLSPAMNMLAAQLMQQQQQAP